MPTYRSSRRIHSPKYAQKKRRRMIAMIVLLVVCIIALAVSTVLLFRSSLLTIDTVVINDLTPDSQLSTNEIQQKVLALFADPKQKISSNILFVSKDKIEKALRDQFKQIDTLTISRSGLRKITLTLRDRQPTAIVCFGFREDSVLSDCYLSDKHAYVFMPIASSTLAVDASSTAPSSADSYMHYYDPSDTENNPLGTAFIDESKLTDLQKFVDGAKTGGLDPLGVLIGDSGNYEMYIKNKKGNSEVTIYFDDKAPFDATLSNLLTFWQNSLTALTDTDKAQATNVKYKKATTTDDFDYINLRYGNTVYYSTQ